MTNWWGIKKETDLKKLKQETNRFLTNLEKSLENFEHDGDPSKLKNNLKKTIGEFRENIE